MHRLLRVVLATSVVTLWACDEIGEGFDAGIEDAGFVQPDSSVTDGGSDPDSGVPTDAGPTDSGSPTDAGPTDGGPIPYVPPALDGQLFIGHFLGNYEVASLDGTTLVPTTGSPYVLGAPGGDLLAIGKHDVVVIAFEGTDRNQFVALDTSSMTPIAGSPYSTDVGPSAFAHDDARDLLYVHCIHTIGNPAESSLTVYDTSSVPWQEVAGSPFAIDVPVLSMRVDPVTGNLFGLSVGMVWGGKLDNGVFTHLPGSPHALDDFGGGIAVDPMRRRLVYSEARFSQSQLLHVRSLDDFSVDPATPVMFGSQVTSDLVVHLKSGRTFAIDYGASTLHAFSADLVQEDFCGTMGCPIPTVETGLAIDYDRDVLFIPHLRDAQNPDQSVGFLTAWDVSAAAGTNPVELTSSARPDVFYYPNRMTLK